ncbi:MAG: cytochrome c biogenesis protein CcdA [Flavobacteriaceae bacterium]
MKAILLLILTSLTWISGWAQTEDDPVRWTHEVRDLGGEEFELIVKGKILEGWHVYSQFTAEGGSLPSEFSFENAGEGYQLLGQTQEGPTEKAYSEIFEVEETFFKGEALFTQKIKRLSPELRRINVSLFYQVCKEVCIPMEIDFVISLDGAVVSEDKKTVDANSLLLGNSLRLDLKHKEMLSGENGFDPNSKNGLWTIFGLGFVGGLIALLTPCVFPMIPLTVSFFTKRVQNKRKGVANAIFYGFCIVLIYFLLSLPFHAFDTLDSQILNTIATNIWINILFFLIFVFFAFSFFGYYELTLPSSWANKMDAASSRAGGILGIFFMAVTLAIVSFSCTGPILGGLLGSTTLSIGDVATNLSAGMTGFGLALALPFALFALFPSWLNSIPKSGSWMNTVKVFLGFLELALAFKFLSNADLVGNWGILKREVFLGVWILIFLLLAIYLLGGIRFPQEEKQAKLSGLRKMVGVLSIFFSIYLLSGALNYTSLKLLSGFPPPDFYSVVDNNNECPLGLECFKDFQQGVAHAKESNKPILLDFTGWACVNCRKMEETVWSDPEVYPLIHDQFVLISLYIDDRTPLAEQEQFNFEFTSGNIKTINTVGEKWGTFQTVNFGAASQPYYVLLSPELEVLNSSIQNTDSETYRDWLQKGLDSFRQSNAQLSSAVDN